jgi:putative endonuclease
MVTSANNSNKNYYVYILTNASQTLYVGMTNDLARRVYQHRHGEGSAFTHRYGLDKLVYYETTNSVHVAIAREKEIKAWRREKKLALIRAENPNWLDLAATW